MMMIGLGMGFIARYKKPKDKMRVDLFRVDDDDDHGMRWDNKQLHRKGKKGKFHVTFTLPSSQN
jgi:hypothetical protein